MEGIKFYKGILEHLLDNGIEPFVTLFHWDLPHNLDEQHNGWLNSSIVNAFDLYARVCFQHFGGLVKHWLTFNEPLSFCWLGYGSGLHAPGRCSDRSRCTAGNSQLEPYIAGHNVLLSHARAVKSFRQMLGHDSKQQIGIALNADWAEPWNASSPADIAASERHMQFQLAWLADPIYFGDYPASMKERLPHLPKFSRLEQWLLKGSTDFFGINHYSSKYVKDGSHNNNDPSDAEKVIKLYYDKDGLPIGPRADSEWLWVVPWGMRKLLSWIDQRYHYPIIYVTENGVNVPGESKIYEDATRSNEDTQALARALNDTFRVKYYEDYLAEVKKAIELDGVDVRGYFAWSFVDNFEWADGYDKRFGLHFIDYNNNLKRHPKQSAKWFAQFIAKHKSNSNARIMLENSAEAMVEVESLSHRTQGAAVNAEDKQQ